MRKSRTQKGITLVALITTVVVLCILAATAIGTIQKDGLISKSQGASGMYNNALKDDEAFMQEGESILDEVLGGITSGGGSNGSGSSNSAPESVFLWKSDDPSSADYGTVIGYTANIDNYPSLRFPNRCKKITVEFSEDLDEDTRREMRTYTENIKEIELPETVVEIGLDAFSNYTFSSLKKINIPKSVTTIGNYVFEDSKELISITFDGTMEEWNQIELEMDWDYGSSVGEIMCSDGRIFLCFEYELSADGTYYTVSGISNKTPTNLVIPAGYNNLPVEKISDDAFVSFKNIITVEIPNTINVMGDSAFAHCVNLTTMNFNGTVDEWNQIDLGTYWNSFVSVEKVTCTNGEVSLITLASAIKNEAGNDISNQKVATNTIAYDEYGNKIVVPAGFKIRVDGSTNYADNVTKGIVIEDESGNQFVWVPVGKIYTDTDKTESLAKIITLGRYENFEATNGVYTPVQIAENYATAKKIGSYSEDTISNHESYCENAIARDIGAFVTSATTNGGYYIGRFEAGNSNGTLVCKYDQTVYNNITQPDASIECQSMYEDGYSRGTFSSDLINSYAWDTAIIFIQTFGIRSNSATYSSNEGVSAIWGVQTTGTNILDETSSIDEQLNIYDMAGNCQEWSTETYNSLTYFCVSRGSYYNNSNTLSERFYNGGTEIEDYTSFRPLIYVAP